MLITSLNICCSERPRRTPRRRFWPAQRPSSSPPHGFPEFWYSWRHQIDPLGCRRFPCHRSRSARLQHQQQTSRGASSYALSHLTSDILAIADQMEQPRVFLAGHDWGAAVAWSVALLHPQRVAKLAILNVPHPSVMTCGTNRRQLLRAVGTCFSFSFPFSPKPPSPPSTFASASVFSSAPAAPGTFSPEDLVQHAAPSQPGEGAGLGPSSAVLDEIFRRKGAGTAGADKRTDAETEIKRAERGFGEKRKLEKNMYQLRRS